MPMRMTWKGPWPVIRFRRPPAVPVVIAPADARDLELRALREENARLRDVAERIADTAAAAVARERVAAQNVARNLDAAAFGAEQKLELALSIMIPEQREIYDGELIMRGGAGEAGPSIEGRSPMKHLAYQEHIRSARTRRRAY